MTARLIPTASEEEWLAARRAGVTASEIAVVLGLSPYSSPYKLYHQKLGNLPPDGESDAMALGNHMESFVADRFAKRHPDLYVSGNGRELYAHADRPWQMATPDRCVYEAPQVIAQCTCSWPEAHPGIDHDPSCPADHGGPIAVLECKIDGGSDEWGDDGSDEIPVHYRAQVLWQMDVMGVDNAYVACLLWNKRKVRVYEFTLDGDALADLKLMREEARDFLDRIDLNDPPDVDWRPATTETLKRLHPGVEDRDVEVRRMPIIQYRAACKAYKAAEQRKKLAENRLRLLLGNGHRIVSAHTGEVIARRDVYPVREHVRKATTVDKLVPVKPKENPA